MKIAVLGPRGTFSELACNKYCRYNNIKAEYQFYPSVMKVAHAINDNDLCILPLENTLDGFLQETIDVMLQNDYQIITDLKIPVDFSFVGNSKDISNIKKVYVQFKAKGQCLDFLTKYDFKIIQTDSNIESLDLCLAADETAGAIIPFHKGHDYDFPLLVEGVTDKKNNFTRFIVIDKNKTKPLVSKHFKCCLCVYALIDKPGILFNLLKNFNDEKINLGVIMSRPTKEEIGKYNFYIECLGNENDLDNLNNVIKVLNGSIEYKTKILGIYSSID